jgi:hypothetical protein
MADSPHPKSFFEQFSRGAEEAKKKRHLRQDLSVLDQVDAMIRQTDSN